MWNKWSILLDFFCIDPVKRKKIGVKRPLREKICPSLLGLKCQSLLQILVFLGYNAHRQISVVIFEQFFMHLPSLRLR